MHILSIQYRPESLLQPGLLALQLQHVVEGAPGFTWHSDNWLQRHEGMPFEPLYDHSAASSSGGSGAAGSSVRLPAFAHPGGAQRPAAAAQPVAVGGGRPY